MRYCLVVRRLLLVSLIAQCLVSAARAGQVATDGTVGPARTLSGPNFNIGSNLGQIRGGNLFHSFQTFDLSAGEIATFTGPASVHNVFARVTGPNFTTINGTIRNTIPNASFYLVNPNGVVFGPDAKLDVKGSFTVTTADTIKLGAGGSFNASNPSASKLTTAAPAAFGFINPQTGEVIVQGTATRTAKLQVPQGGTLQVVSGPISITHGALIAASGQVNLVAVSTSGDVPITAGGSVNGDAVPASSLADIFIAETSEVSVDGPGGGALLVRAADLTLDNSSISSTTLGDRPGLNGEIAVTGLMELNAATINANTAGVGRAGNLAISAGSLVLDGSGSTAPTGIAADTLSASRGAGDAGNLTIHAKTIQILAGADISAGTAGRGRGGSLTITADDLTLDDRGNSQPDVTSAGIFADANPGATGAAGDLNIKTGTLRVLAGAQVTANTSGPGAGGNLNINAANITVDEGGNVNPAARTTGIFAETLSSARGAGSAGDVNIHADSVHVLAGGVIAASTSGAGRGGNLTIAARRIDADGSQVGNGSSAEGIFAESLEGAIGASGDLTLRASVVNVTAGAAISADTFGTGHGGNLSLRANTVVVDDRGDPDPTSNVTKISTDSESDVPGAGNAGNLAIRANNVSVLAGGAISSSTFGPGNGGNLALSAGVITVDGAGNAQPALNLTGILDKANDGATGSAGDLIVRATTLRVLTQGEISASTNGTGNGGNLTVFATNITLDDAQDPSPAAATGLFANTNFTGRGAGNGGVITIVSRKVHVLGGASISASTNGPGRGGDLSLTAQSLHLDDRGDLDTNVDNTGVFTVSEGGSGAAGNLTIHATDIGVLAGASITASTFGAGRGGDANVIAHSIVVDDRGDQHTDVNNTDISVSSESTASGAGAAGNLLIRGGDVRVVAGGELSAATFGPGAGGKLTLIARDLLVNGAHNPVPESLTGVFAATNDPARDAGPGGSVNVNAGRVDVLAGGQISAATFGAGRGGELSLTAGNLLVDDAGDAAPSVDTSGVFAQSSIGATGNAGNLTVQAGAINLVNGGQINAGTDGPGTGGSVTVTTQSLLVDGINLAGLPSAIIAKATSTGAAGSVIVSSHDGLTVSHDATIGASATDSGAGNVAVSSDGFIVLDGGILSARAQQAGGSISITTPLFFQLVHHGSVITESGAADGGNITINALEMSVRQSRINANGGINGGNVAVDADATPGLVDTGPLAGRNLTATGATGVSGNISNGPANSDVARSLAQLPAELQANQLTLQPQCGQTVDVSTFLIQGRGGVSDDPELWDFGFGP